MYCWGTYLKHERGLCSDEDQDLQEQIRAKALRGDPEKDEHCQEAVLGELAPREDETAACSAQQSSWGSRQ